MKLRMFWKIASFSRRMYNKHKVMLSNSLFCWWNGLIKNFYPALNNLPIEVDCSSDADRDLNDLLWQLAQDEDESHLTGYSKPSEEYRSKENIWKSCAAHLDKEWDELWCVTTDRSLEHDRDTLFSSTCNICRISSASVSCKCCKKILCSSCDYSIHCEQVTSSDSF